VGDYLVYRIGANIPSDRIPVLRRTKDQAALPFTQCTFRTRGSALVLSGRFIPVGCTVVNMSAGATP
jgi:membrane protein DedA with SNARE-associated domain